jgi:5'-nucleotidase
MENNIFVADKQQLQNKIEKFRNDGINKVHIISDFDRTLTRFMVDGRPVDSVMIGLRKSSFLISDYAIKAEEIQNRFYPLQIDPDVSIEAKKVNLLK